MWMPKEDAMGAEGLGPARQEVVTAACTHNYSASLTGSSSQQFFLRGAEGGRVDRGENRWLMEKWGAGGCSERGCPRGQTLRALWEWSGKRRREKWRQRGRRYKCKEREGPKKERGATNCMVLSGFCGWGLVGVTAKMEEFMGERKKGQGGGDGTGSLWVPL